MCASATRPPAGFGVAAAPYGLSRAPMPLGPTAYGLPPANARTLLMMCGSASRFSIAVRSSQACTIGQLVWTTKSSRSAGGRLRFSSVK